MNILKNNISVELTADGSATLYRSDLDEHYHSVKGALAESRHVYIDMCWKKATESFDDITLFEVGFGSGLNAALTASEALKREIPTNYYSVEFHPLSEEIIKQLHFFEDDDKKSLFSAIHQAEWNKEIIINPFFSITKICADFTSLALPTNLNAVYFDAFAPEKQPSMWSDEIFKRIYNAMNPNGILTTYCAKGSIRRMLQHIGFMTERLPGPPNGKREILRATAIKS